jgi:hypothetical protein
MKSSWETYQGKRIFIGRYNHLPFEEIQPEASAVEKEMLIQPHNSVLLIVTTAGTIISPQALNIFKNVALHSKPFIKKTAILGMTGARKAILDIVVRFSGMQVSSFEDMQKAKDWLVMD